MLYLLACQSESALNEASEAKESTSPPYIVPEDTAPVQADRSPEEVALAVEDAIHAAQTLNVEEFFTHYSSLMNARSSSCPYINPDYLRLYSYLYWYDSCTTESTISYSGYGYGYDFAGYTSGDYYYPFYAYLQGDLSITDTSGATLTASGQAGGYEYQYYASRYRSMYAYGDFRSNSPELQESWLGMGLSSSFAISIYKGGPADPGYININGGVSRLPGEFSSIWFNNVYASGSSDCPLEPGGVIQVRDGNSWYDVHFQGPASGGNSVFQPDCDGCGDIWFRDTIIGSICPDLSRLFAIEEWLP